MRLLDLFCGAGGAAVGYHRAGFDEIVGVDNRPQKNYPFNFVLADALEYVAEHGHEFDVIHASPPCQAYANVTQWRGQQRNHPDLVPDVIELLQHTSKPWVLENVSGAPFVPSLILCGSMFGLRIKRHRWFLLSFETFQLMPSCCHRDILPFMHKGERAFANAMQCSWMTNREAREAIPPCYTEYLGQLLLIHIKARALNPIATAPGM